MQRRFALIGHQHALSDLTDFFVGTPNDGDVLTYDSSTGLYGPEAPAGGTLDSLTDVATTGVGTGDLLKYDGAGWVDDPVLGIGDLTDPNADRILFWDDSAGSLQWLTLGTNLTITGTTLDAAGSASVALDDLTDVATTGVGTGDLLKYNGSGWVDDPVLGIGDLTDPNADRIMFWDDSGGALAWLTAGTGLSISGTTITSSNVVVPSDRILGDHFVIGDPNSGELGVLEWTYSGTTARDVTESRPGVVSQTTAATTFAQVHCYLGSATTTPMLATRDVDEFVFVFKLDTTADHAFRGGLLATIGSFGTQEAIFFESDPGLGHTSWRFTSCDSGGTYNRQDTGVAFDTGWHTFRARRSGTTWYGSIDGGSEVTLSTNLPSAGTGLNFGWALQTNTTAAKNVKCDYAGMYLSANGYLNGSSTSLDHGALGGLSDDDHPQYPQITTTETISGVWTHSAQLISTVSAGGTTSAIHVNSNIPALSLYESDGGSDAKGWDWVVNGGVILLRAYNDASTLANTVMDAVRSGYTIQQTRFYNGSSVECARFSGGGVLQLFGDFGSAANLYAGGGAAELGISGGRFFIQTYNRNTTAYYGLSLSALDIDVSIQATTQAKFPSDGGFALKDGITAPATVTGMAVMYVDSADGDLKIKFSDGTVKTIVVDT